jgi:hypothetical protein
MNGLKIRKIHNGIPIRMTAAKMMRSHLNTAQVQHRLISVNNTRLSLLLSSHHILPGIFVRNDLDIVNKPDIATRVVSVVMSINDVPDRLIRKITHPRLNLVDIPRKLVVDQNDTHRRYTNADIPANAIDVIQPLFNGRHG